MKRRARAELPTAKEISPGFRTGHEALDERCAREHFSGKTLEEAEELFRQNALFYEEDLLWMGAAGFRYYVVAFVRYLESEQSSGDSDALNAFVSLLEQRSREPKVVAPIGEFLKGACGYLLQDFERYDADPAIYGDLRGKLQALETSLCPTAAA